MTIPQAYFRRTLACAALLLATACLPAAAYAASDEPNGVLASDAKISRSTDEARDPAAILQRVQKITDGLELTAEQRKQIDGYFEQAQGDLRNSAADLQNASPSEKEGEFREVLSDLRGQIAGVLTDEQKQTLQEKLQSLRRAATHPSATAEATSAKTLAATPPAESAPAGGTPSDQGAAPSAERPGGAAGAGRAGNRLERLRADLNQVGLSNDQKTKIDAVLSDLKSQIKQMRQGLKDGSVSRDDVKSKLAALVSDARTQMSAALTPQQQQRLRALRAEPEEGSGPANRRGRPAASTPPAKTAAQSAGSAAPADSRANVSPSTSPSMPSPVVSSPVLSSLVLSSPDRSANGSAVSVEDAHAAPDIGQPAPDFRLINANGTTVSLASSRHHVLVLVFGSYTAPALRDHIDALQQLAQKVQTPGVDFLLVYTKEQHPVGGWEIQRNKDQHIELPRATTAAQRQSAINQMRQQLHLSIPIVADTMDNGTETKYGVAETVPAFVVDRDGKIAFHQSWLEPNSLARAVDEAVKGK